MVLAVLLAAATTIASTAPARGAMRPPTATGTVTCGSPGVAVITWTITHYPEVPGPITITSAGMFGAVGGPVSFAPATVQPGGQTTARVEVDGSIVGEVGLRATMIEFSELTIGAGTMLRGNCAPPPPAPPPPPPPLPAVVPAVVDGVHPTYVG
jgi:hypothetical protein